MTVPVQTIFNSYTSAGTSTFVYSFQALSSSHIVVTVNGITKTLGTDYAVTGVGVQAGGTITGLATVAGDAVVIKRMVPLERLTDYQNNGDLLAKTLNPDFDSIWQALQQLQQYGAKSSLRGQDGETLTALAAAATRAGKMPVFNASTGDVELSTFTFTQVASAVAAAYAAGSTADAVTFLQAGAGAIPRTVQTELREWVKVTQYGAVADNATDNSSAFASAIAAVPTNGTLYFPPGVYRGHIFIWRSDITLLGAGSASTIIKLPNSSSSVTVPWEGGGTKTGLPNVIEVGECAMGNLANAYSNVSVIGMTLDGNYSNNTAPTIDLFGHGIIVTKTSNLFIDDVVSKNCYLTGIDCCINSNYAKVDARVDNCGQAALSYPNFDINSSKYGIFNIISSGGKYGGRMLDNCWGNQLNILIYNPSITGFVYNNQTVNASYSNTINVNVVDGCNSGQGVSIGANCHNSIVNATIRNVTGTGFYVNGGSAIYAPRGNKFNIATYYCGSASVNETGISNQYTITSRWDGRTGAAGSVFAVDVNGSYNQFTINIEDQAVPQVRGVVIRSGAQYNNIVDYTYNTNVQAFLNQDTGNTTKYSNVRVPYINNAGLWQSASVSAGWSNAFGSPYPSAEYIIDTTGCVSMRGTVNGGTGTICTLPAGYRPTATMLFPTIANGAIGRLSVDSSGVVTLLSGTATSVDLSPISFYTY